MTNKSAMGEALRRKKAKALDISILIGSPEDEKMMADSMPGDEACDLKDGAMPGEDDEARELGMAPEAEIVGEDAPQSEMGNDPSMIAEELAKAGLGKNSLAHRVAGTMHGKPQPKKK